MILWVLIALQSHAAADSPAFVFICLVLQESSPGFWYKTWTVLFSQRAYSCFNQSFSVWWFSRFPSASAKQIVIILNVITRDLKQWMPQMWSEKVPTSTNEQMSWLLSPQLTFIWVLQLRPILSVYTCRAFRAVAAALGSLCCFPSPLAWHWPRLMVDWTRKHSAAFEEDVKLSACFPPVQASRGRQWWTDRQSSRPQHSKLNNPTLTTSRGVLSSKWMSFGKWGSLGSSQSVLPLSLQVISHTQVNESLLRLLCLFTLSKQSS